MKRRILRTSALFLSSIGSFAPHGVAPAESPASNYSKKLRVSVLARPDLSPSLAGKLGDPPPPSPDRYPWKKQIVTTTFWVGEAPTKNNPVPNHVSSWDAEWAKHFGGTDNPDPAQRANYIAVGFVPQQNPFYVALPYNDKMKVGHKPEAPLVVPWFKRVYRGPGQSVCKGRWIAIKFGDRICYAQWEDCGPFRTDHWQYVFGNERPKANLNKGAGLDVSPGVRDFLGMNSSDVTDWKFVDFEEVPTGPWSAHGDNNTFVINKRVEQERAASATGLTPKPVFE